jgi:hypothetical protein
MAQGFPVGGSQIAAEKAAALQRAAAVKRRLLREAAEMGGVLDGDAQDLVAAWTGSSGSGGARPVVSYYV